MNERECRVDNVGARSVSENRADTPKELLGIRGRSRVEVRLSSPNLQYSSPPRTETAIS